MSSSERFDQSEMLAAAERETGLSDWGEPGFCNNMQVLLESLEETGHLSNIGHQALWTRMHATLCNRLRLEEDRKRIPEIRQQKIERPIIVLGMGRTGSSNLLELLACDPTNRVLRTWEVMTPSPPPERATYNTDPRIARTQQALDLQNFDDPVLQDAHPFSATLPEECGLIYEFMFASGNYCAFANTEKFTRWHSNEADFRAVFAYHRRFLQHLQSRCRGDRWALKCPENILHPREMIEQYSDAIFVHTHRDPAQVLPSLASLFRSLRRVFADPVSVDPLVIGRELLESNVVGLERTWQARQGPSVRDRFYDIHFGDLIQQPINTIESFYRHFDLGFSDEARRAMTLYVDNVAKAKHGHGRHRYSMTDFGFTNDILDKAFRPYMQRYGIRNRN